MSREELHETLVSKLGSRNVYYNPPENITLVYPCIVYSLSSQKKRYANGGGYIMEKSYMLTYINPKVDDNMLDSLLEMPFSKHDRSFKTNNLNHAVVTIVTI